jgi:ADP-ribose pyrophosphatase YjhB (NUDIX family)
MKTKVETVVFVVKDGKILLAEKKTDNNVGVAVDMLGKLNGYGGVCKVNETFEECAIREFQEEARPARILKNFLTKVGEIDFIFFSEERSRVNLHIFISNNMISNPSASREMKKPEWHPIDSLPEGRMIPSDLLWIPRILRGEKIKGELIFSRNKKLLDVTIDQVEGF